MSGNKNKSSFWRPVHLQAVFFLILYSIISKSIFIKSISSENNIIAFLVPYLFGVVAGMVFLYLFSHEDFFHFIKEVEQMQSKKENNFLKKYRHYGKVICTLVVAAVGGPVFAALTIRLLLNRYKYKYFLIAVGNITSTIIHVSTARGLFVFFF